MIHSVPKPARQERKPRKPLKRSAIKKLLARQASIPRSKPLPRNRKPIRKVNPEKLAKRRAAYRKKLDGYKRSETYKLVEARAAGQCEGMDTVMYRWSARRPELVPYTVAPYRCSADRRYHHKLTHHHLTYARFGGNEKPEDIKLLCDRHHAEAEAQHTTRNRNYRKAS